MMIAEPRTTVAGKALRTVLDEAQVWMEKNCNFDRTRIVTKVGDLDPNKPFVSPAWRGWEQKKGDRRKGWDESDRNAATEVCQIFNMYEQRQRLGLGRRDEMNLLRHEYTDFKQGLALVEARNTRHAANRTKPSRWTDDVPVPPALAATFRAQIHRWARAGLPPQHE